MKKSSPIVEEEEETLPTVVQYNFSKKKQNTSLNYNQQEIGRGVLSGLSSKNGVSNKFQSSYNGPPQISEQLNPDAREIVIMPEATLLKLVEEILERKFEQDEKKPQHAAIKTANQSTNSLNSISMLMNQQQ